MRISVFAAACLFGGCGGAVSTSTEVASGPCDPPPAWTCTEHHKPDYRRCDEPSGLGWLIFPDGVAYREVRIEGDHVETIECRVEP